MSYYYTNSTEPLVMLAWDIKVTEHLTTAVVSFGTKESIAKLKKRKRLPTYEEVRAARAYLGDTPDF